ncbi:MAG TPA: response regulator [Chloroflexota bacterium]
MPRANAYVLVVEDQAVIATWLQLRLERLGYAVLDSAATAEDAIAKTSELTPDIVLMDIHLGGGSDGVAAAIHIREQFGIPVVLVTGSADDQTLRRAKEAGVEGFLRKPFDERQLHTCIETALRTHRAGAAQEPPPAPEAGAQPGNWRVRALLHKLNNELAVATAILDLLQDGRQLPAGPGEQVHTAQQRLVAVAQITAQLQRVVDAPPAPEPSAAAAPDAALASAPEATIALSGADPGTAAKLPPENTPAEVSIPAEEREAAA